MTTPFNNLPTQMQSIINHIRYCGMAQARPAGITARRWSSMVLMSHQWVKEITS